jgi:hypothetical protein
MNDEAAIIDLDALDAELTEYVRLLNREAV